VKITIVLKTEDSTIQCHTPRHNTPTHQAPVMTVNVDGGSKTSSPEPQNLLILLEEDPNKQDSDRLCTPPSTEQQLHDKPPTPPIFFRYTVMSVGFIEK
jgi:hypothetical protein